MVDHWASIMALMVTQVESFGFALGTESIPVVQRKMPQKNEVIDPNTQIVICPSELEPKIERYGMQKPGCPAGVGRVTYYTDIVLITPNDGDNQANLTTYTTWLQQLSEMFSSVDGLPGIQGLQDCRCRPLKFLDPDKMNNAYDYFGLRLDPIIVKSLIG